MALVDVEQVKRHIKPKADSTLRNMRKTDLIEYIRCLEHNYDVAVSFNENQAKYIESLNIASVTSEPCGFCGKFNFGDARAEVYRNGANIVLASSYARFPAYEQFNFCPVCGRRVKKDETGEAGDS